MKEQAPEEYKMFKDALDEYNKRQWIKDPIIANEFKLITRKLNKEQLKYLAKLMED